MEWADIYLFQLILEEPGKATFHVFEDRQPKEEVEKAAAGLRGILGEDWELKVNYTDRLKPEKRGKYCFVKSLFQPEMPGLFGAGRPG